MAAQTDFPQTFSGCWNFDLAADVLDPTTGFGRFATISSTSGDGVTYYRVVDAFTGAELPATTRMDLYDPITGYAYLASPGPDDDVQQPLHVYDPHTGQIIFELDAATASQLAFRARFMYGGYLYASTVDGNPVVDVATGEVVTQDDVPLPVGEFGGWTLYDDGLLTTRTDRLPDAPTQPTPTPTRTPSR